MGMSERISFLSVLGLRTAALLWVSKHTCELFSGVLSLDGTYTTSFDWKDGNHALSLQSVPFKKQSSS